MSYYNVFKKYFHVLLECVDVGNNHAKCHPLSSHPRYLYSHDSLSHSLDIQDIHIINCHIIH
jgi:hypothetical protein